MSKNIKTFKIEPYYMVTYFPDTGECEIISTSKHKNGGIMQKWINNNGYYCYKLMNKVTPIHQIIRRQFLSEDKDGYCVNHKDSNKLNNSLDNLEYITICDNILHAIENGTHVANHPERHGKYKDGRTIGRKTEYKHDWYLSNRERILTKRKYAKTK